MEHSVRLDDLINAIKGRHPDGDPLGELSDAVTLGEHLGEVADHLIGHFVDRARHAGASWTDIGRSMGVTKQAAQKRFVPKEGGSGSLADDLRSYTRYTDRARVVLVRAQEEARGLGHDHIEVGHLVLGLLHEPQALAARAMEACGVSLASVRKAVVPALGPGSPPTPGTPPFSAQSKKALELTLREALRLGHNYVGTEHLLLAVLRLKDDPATRALSGLGVTAEPVEEHVTHMLGEVLLRQADQD
ncbi:Clp protease N-terminal domain-containing protein [Nonomuraea sp. SBT364]|uniref:Clp protease N-terminal domain-containing protein n=1 Tax=Nonomuraea sp. SBT364 TaxID=1580530 RepID=UPI00066D817C|nr:Clp protease N-terminal domain-containing protein [Nonomuraea sp. SBT364]